MSRRILVNLVAFGVLAASLVVWALTNYVTFGLTEPPSNHVVFEFAESPGLQVGFEVAYLGHAVGSIDRVRLQDDRVLVDASMDPDEPVPARVDARVRRKSAVGEPYVDMTPRGAVGPDAPLLSDGDVVPLARTSVPLSYEEVFRSVADALAEVPTDAAGTIVHELATALEGREGDLQRLVGDTQDVLATSADRADLLDSLASESTRLTAMLADLAPRTGRALDATAPVVAEIAAARDDLVAVIEQTPGLATRVADLVRDSREPLGCLLGSLEASLADLDTPEHAAQLHHAIDVAPHLIALLRTSTHERDGGPWLRVDPIFNMGESSVARYAEPLPLPQVPTPATCDAVPALEAPTAADADDAGTPGPVTLEAVDQGPAPVPTATASEDAVDDRASSDLGTDPGWRPPWWLFLIVVSGVVAATRPWRRFDGRDGS